ncbi:MAG: polymer-forming cytoskeletal protein [Alphaproteobacteria bacterium]
MVWDFLFGSKDNAAGGHAAVSLDVTDPRTVESHCLISGNLHIRGDVFFSGILRVDGKIDGKVAVYEGGRGQLVVGKGASINGPVQVTSAIVDGAVAGVMDVADKLECRAHAILSGEVTYGLIHIADGAKIEAKCKQREAGRAESSATNFLAKGRS